MIKCPKCWAKKAKERDVNFLQGVVYSCLFLAPMKCRHCFHDFSVSKFSLLVARGKQGQQRRATRPDTQTEIKVVAGKIHPDIQRMGDQDGPRRRAA